jgi:pimeloyl-ACP methyl ester carboxylesterase
MKKVLFVLTILLNTVCVMAQADYPAAVAKFQRYYNQKQADSLFNMYGPNMKAALPLDKTTAMINQLNSQTGTLKSVTPLKTGNTYKAVFDKVTLKLSMHLNDDNLLEGLFLTAYEEMKDSDNVVLNGIHGTLIAPPGSKKVVLFIAGSGPTDRDGNSGTNLRTNCTKMMAEALEKAGIASLRYDKRSIGAADITPEKDLRFENMVDDAVALIKMLKERYAQVYVAGHSEGSLVGMLASKTDVAGYISIAGAGEAADILIGKQLKILKPNSAAQASLLMDSLKKGYPVKEPSGELNALFHSSVQPYMTSWMKYDPQQEIKKLKIPVLIIQGTTDIQVSTQDAELLKKAKPDATLLEIEGMNHVLKTAPAERNANWMTYNQPDLPLKEELMKAIIPFVLAQK